MSVSMSRASVALFVQYLTSLSGLLDKAEAHATASNISPSVLLECRLFPDMHPLSSQVQFACDFAKGAVTRLAGVPVPSFKDDEATFDQLRTRISRTLDIILSIAPEQMDGASTRDVALNFGGTPLRFKGDRYLFGFAIPSMIFHVATAYAILRSNGVVIGKADFLGQIDGS